MPTLFLAEVCHLARTVAELLRHPSVSGDAEACDTWNDYFTETVFSVLLCCFVDVAAAASSVSPACIRSLGEALQYIPDQQLFSHQLPAKFLVEDVDCDANFPEKLLFLLNHLCPLVAAAEVTHVQETAFRLLLRYSAASRRNLSHVICTSTLHSIFNRIMDRLVVEEERQATSADSGSSPRKRSEKNDDGDEVDRDEYRELPRRLTDLLRLTGPPVAALFVDFDFGEPAPALPAGTPARACAAAFLMSWRLALRLVAGAGKGDADGSKPAVDLRPKYSEFLRSEGLLDELMPVLFHLLPSSSPSPEDEDGIELASLAASVYMNLLRHLPALVSDGGAVCLLTAA